MIRSFKIFGILFLLLTFATTSYSAENSKCDQYDNETVVSMTKKLFCKRSNKELSFDIKKLNPFKKKENKN